MLLKWCLNDVHAQVNAWRNKVWREPLWITTSVCLSGESLGMKVLSLWPPPPPLTVHPQGKVVRVATRDTLSGEALKWHYITPHCVWAMWSHQNISLRAISTVMSEVTHLACASNLGGRHCQQSAISCISSGLAEEMTKNPGYTWHKCDVTYQMMTCPLPNSEVYLRIM